jgi:general nucleoside transport system ATP-binding protein
MRQLSGGNQQKVVLAREFSRHPKLLIAGQPTRGLDIGAVEFVYERLLAHKRQGGATLLVSTELEEILSLSDRIGVMASGRLLGVLDREEATLDMLGLLMAGERGAAA